MDSVSSAYVAGSVTLAAMAAQCPGDDFELVCGVMAPQDTRIVAVDDGIFAYLERQRRKRVSRFRRRDMVVARARRRDGGFIASASRRPENFATRASYPPEERDATVAAVSHSLGICLLTPAGGIGCSDPDCRRHLK